MDEAILQAYARLTAHEFLLEVMYANWLAQMPESNAERMLADFRSRMKRAYTTHDADQQAAEDFGLQIARDAEQLMARLVQEVKEPGEDRGREHLGQGERHVPQRHVSSSRLLAIGKHVAGERPVDGVVGTVADAVEDAEDIEKSERADEAEEQDGYDNGLHGA